MDGNDPLGDKRFYFAFQLQYIFLGLSIFVFVSFVFYSLHAYYINNRNSDNNSNGS